MVSAPLQLLERFGSPLYVYDAALVRRDWRGFHDAFAYRPFDVHFAIVCNKNRCLVRLLHRLGAGIHANTPGDAFAALAAGVPASAIVYSGTNLGRADFDALRGMRMNLDSLDQLRDFAALRPDEDTGLRFLIDDPAHHPNRIGLTAEELSVAVDLAARAGIRLTGLHMYAGTNNRSLRRTLDCLDRMIAASWLLPDLAYLDIGGGFGVAYHDGQKPLDLFALGNGVSERMESLSAERGRCIRLVAEPGRTLVAAAGSLLCRVISIKERGGRRFVGVDSTVGNIVVESVYHSHHRIEAVLPRGELLDIPTDVCGNTTHSRDFLGRDCRLPELRRGDVLVLRDVGAYGYAMSSHFLNRPRPAEVVIDEGEVHLTTRRETMDDLLATQLPA